MSDRDTRLTEAMGKCLHLNIVPDEESGWSACVKCGDLLNAAEYQPNRHKRNFSTWHMFGWLKDFIAAQGHLEEFLDLMDVGTYIKTSDGFTFDMQAEFINPDRLADAYDKYLQERPTNGDG